MLVALWTSAYPYRRRHRDQVCNLLLYKQLPISLRNYNVLQAIKLIACFIIYELFRIDIVEDIVVVLSFEVVKFKP